MAAQHRRPRERQGPGARARETADTLASCTLCGDRPAEIARDGIPLCIGCYLDLDANDRYAANI